MEKNGWRMTLILQKTLSIYQYVYKSVMKDSNACHIFVSIPIMRYMRFFVILAALVTPAFAWAQDAKIAELQQQVNRLESRNSTLSTAIGNLNSKNAALQAQMNSLKEEIKAEITRSQELQAQNERAMNIALDEFEKKFEEQNKTVAAVQDSLDERFNKQLIYFVLSLVAVVLISVILQKSAVNRAIKSHNASWNSFQEHILKK